MTNERDIALTQEQRHEDTTTLFGFWVYLMTDLVLFASLFAVFAVLRSGTFGGPSGKDIFNLPFVLQETIILLSSSFTCGLALLSTRTGKRTNVLVWLLVSGLLGAAFLIKELSEFRNLIAMGYGPSRSAFLSSYFTLVGTHGLHITVGLLWLVVLALSIALRGLTRGNMRKLVLWSMFWHFLDIVWIFIFTVVYLMGLI